MRNSTFKAKQSKPMKRTAWKKKAKKKRDGHDKGMLEACRGQECYLKIPKVCMGLAGISTVVPAHSNQQKHGKGMGLKARDEFTVPACMTCHAWIDQGSADKQVKFGHWDSAFSKWQIDRKDAGNQR
jgi:heterodisulfide reductase subunit B